MRRWSLIVLLAGCGHLPTSASWETAGTYRASFEQVWKACEDTFHDRGWPVRLNDPKAGKLESDWRLRLSPYSGEGFREKAEFQVVRQGDDVQVLFRVIHEQNMAAIDRESAQRADWGQQENDPEKETELKYLLNIKLTKGPP